MKTPDITPVQIVAAVIGCVYPLLTLLGVHFSSQQLDALQQLDVIAVSLFGADAALRIGRSLGSPGDTSAKS